jgi:hypothetical protein
MDGILAGSTAELAMSLKSGCGRRWSKIYQPGPGIIRQQTIDFERCNFEAIYTQKSSLNDPNISSDYAIITLHHLGDGGVITGVPAFPDFQKPIGEAADFVKLDMISKTFPRLVDVHNKLLITLGWLAKTYVRKARG